ncbi:MAG: lipopolysaccharide biosynthesis protein [Pseudodonghicola sp.]
MVRRSFAYAFADKSAGALLAVLTMAIVSRLLTPAEVGLFMIASSLVILIEAFRDFGVAAFLIQEPELTPEVTRSAVTVISLMSLGLGLAIYLGADLLGGLYDNAELAGLIRIAALAFVVAPVSNPLLALLRREMNFAAVARISIAAGLVNATTTIGLAAAGYGAFSFVWGSVLAACTNAVGALICRPQWWIFRPSLQHWRRVVPFGAWSSVITILGMLLDAMPRLILGRFIGFSAVGLFARAVSLMQLPDRVLLSAVQPVILPALSARARNAQGMVEPYLLGLSHISALQWPALLGLALLADPIVRLLLGPQWLEVVPLLRIVALSGVALFPVYLAYPVLVAVGRVREMALVSAITLPVSIAVILTAAQISLTAVAWSLFVINPLQAAVMLYFVRRYVPFGWAELTRVLRRSLAVTLAAGAGPGLAILGFGVALDGWQTALAIAGSAAGWVAGLIMTRHPIAAELSGIAGALPWPGARRRSKTT